MLDVVFIKKTGEVNMIEVDEESFERLIENGLAKNIKYSKKKILFDGEKTELLVANLGILNRKRFIKFIQEQIFIEISMLDNKLKNPTVKEVRDSTNYLITLNKIGIFIKDKSNKYFSFE